MLHAASLVFVAAVLVLVNRRQWFSGDEWAALVLRRLGGGAGSSSVLDPVGGLHWATLPLGVYRGLFHLFGLTTYTPYLLAMIAFQLLVVHLFWRLLLRCGVDRLVALVATTAFGVLGPGEAVLTQSFGVLQTGALALALAALLVAGEEGPWARRDALAALLALASVMWYSGLGIPLVAALGAILVLRRGARVAAGVVAPAAVAFLVWFVAIGRDAAVNEQDEPFMTALRKLVPFVWRGLRGMLDEVTALGGVGAVVIVLLGVWIIVRGRPHAAPWPVSLGLAGAGLLYLSLVDFGRSKLGVAEAVSSRHLYTTAACLLVLGAVAASRLLAPSALRVPIVVVLGAALLLVQVTTLRQDANHRAALEHTLQRRFAAAAAYLREAPDLRLGLQDDYTPTVPRLTANQLRALERDGKLPTDPVTPEELDEARLHLRTGLLERPRTRNTSVRALDEVVGATVETTRRGCVDVTTGAGPNRLRFAAGPPTTIVLGPAEPDLVRLWLVDPDTGARVGPRSLLVHPALPANLFVDAPDEQLEVELPRGSTTELCAPGAGER
jgi:hypothetical protein